MFEFESRIRYSEADYEGKLDLLGILNYFQDCSTFESENFGMGVEEFHKRNLVWVLSTWQIEIIKFPIHGSKITIGTFPHEFKGCFGRRNFYMKDENGQMLAMADTLWTLLNYEEGKPARMTDEIRSHYELQERLPMQNIKSRIIVPKEMEKLNEVVVGKRYLDANLHVNNGQYIRMTLENIEDKGYKFFRAEYRKQIRENDKVIISAGNTENSLVVTISDEELHPATIMEFGL